MQDEAKIKVVLEGERERIMGELGQFASQDTAAAGNFNAKMPQYGESEDENVNEVADYGDRLGLERELESALQQVNRALERLAEGQYGVCEMCGNPIPEPRLAVRPMATTCISCEETRG